MVLEKKHENYRQIFMMLGNTSGDFNGLQNSCFCSLFIIINVCNGLFILLHFRVPFSNREILMSAMNIFLNGHSYGVIMLSVSNISDFSCVVKCIGVYFMAHYILF